MVVAKATPNIAMAETSDNLVVRPVGNDSVFVSAADQADSEVWVTSNACKAARIEADFWG